ncbi:MAG: hypothetical protein J6Y08_02105 [Clostridiales bacterium]|nr:hypothetical protein [Clostridiales bacterium]
MAKTITLQELKPGDLMLLHKPKGSWISVIISVLTCSKVSHTAMVDYNPAFFLEEGQHGASQAKLIDVQENREIYIRRLKNEPDTSKVVDIAREYIKEGHPYPFSNLIFMGLYMLASDFIPDTVEGDLIKEVLKLATYELMRLFNKKQQPGTKLPPMVCSQFAAFCYDEAALEFGPQYKIRYKEGILSEANLLQKILDQLSGNTDKVYPLEKPEHGLLLAIEDSFAAAEGYCEKLVEHIEQKNLLSRPSEVSESVITAMYQYARAFLKVFDDKDYPDKDHATADEIKEVLSALLQFQEAFISPGDLLSNTTNLEDMGTLTYTEEELRKYMNENAD